MLAHADTLGNWHKHLCTRIPTKLEPVPAKLEVLWFKLFRCWDVVEVALFLPFLPAPSALVRTILNPNYLWSQLVEALEWFSSIKCSRLLCLSFITRLSSVATATLTLKRRTVALFRFPQNFEFCKILPGFFPISHFPWLFLSRWVPTWSDKNNALNVNDELSRYVAYHPPNVFWLLDVNLGLKSRRFWVMI